MRNYSNDYEGMREAAGLTVEDAARALGTSRASVRSWEAGTTAPSPRTVGRLAALYGVGRDEAEPRGALVELCDADILEGVRLGAVGTSQASRELSRRGVCLQGVELAAGGSYYVDEMRYLCERDQFEAE